MAETTALLNYLWAQLIVEELFRNGISDFCLSPGSRCTPLTVAIASRGNLNTTVHFDERGMGFFAIGLARALNRPTVLLSTSGTAVANYFPAIVEAAMDCIPLIILTADRPPELRKTDANQTVDQVKIFGDYVRWHFDIPCPTVDIRPETILTTVDQAIHQTRRIPSGPVHLNCMFRQPFLPDNNDLLRFTTGSSITSLLSRLTLFPETGRIYEDAKSSATKPHQLKEDADRSQQQHKFSHNYGSSIVDWQKHDNPYTRYPLSKTLVPRETIDEIATAIEHLSNGLIILGRLHNDEERSVVLDLVQKLNWPVYVDITSGLRMGYPNTNFIHYFDLILHLRNLPNLFAPSMVMQFGGKITSKRLYEYIKTISPGSYYVVDKSPFRINPEHISGNRIEADIPTFCRALIDKIPGQSHSSALQLLKKFSQKVDNIIEHKINAKKSLGELEAARLISRYIPKKTGLFIASSMPIRNMNLFAVANGSPGLLGINRGASGIDGTLASAVGFAKGLGRGPTTLLIGDLALLHDLNSLALVKSEKMLLIVVVINNNGGGIFSFLPVSQHKPIFERYFGTPHHLDFKQAAQMFGLTYTKPSNRKDFVNDYKQALTREQGSLIEIESDRQQTVDFHTNLVAQVTSEIQELLS